MSRFVAKQLSTLTKWNAKPAPSVTPVRPVGAQLQSRPKSRQVARNLTSDSLTPATRSDMDGIRFKVTPSQHLPPIIILHGLLHSSLNWDAPAAHLAQACDACVYTVDLRNHGSSLGTTMSYPLMAQDLRHLLDNEGIERVCLIGHSMGGKVAMQFAMESPERIDRLVIADSAPMVYHHVPGVNKAVQLLQEADVPSCATVDEAHSKLQKLINDPSSVESWVKNIVRDEKTGLLRWHFNLHAISASIFNLICASFPAKPLNPAITLHSPSPVGKDRVLFIRGSQSKFVDEEGQKAVRTHFPSAEIISLPGGHNIFQDCEADFLRVTADFIKSDRNLDRLQSTIQAYQARVQQDSAARERFQYL